MLTCVCLAVDIIYQTTFAIAVRKPFFVQKLYVGDLPLTFEQTVKEVDQQRFGDFLAKNALETDIGERIDKFTDDDTSLWFNDAKLAVFFGFATLRA